MKKITLQEYLTALKVVNAYRRQNKKFSQKKDINIEVTRLLNGLSISSKEYDFKKLPFSLMMDFGQLHDVSTADNQDGILEICFNRPFSTVTDEQVERILSLLKRSVKNINSINII